MPGSAEVVRLHATVAEQSRLLLGQAATINRLVVDNTALGLAFAALRSALERRGVLELNQIRAEATPLVEALAAQVTNPAEQIGFESVVGELMRLLADPMPLARPSPETAH